MIYIFILCLFLAIITRKYSFIFLFLLIFIIRYSIYLFAFFIVIYLMHLIIKYLKSYTKKENKNENIVNNFENACKILSVDVNSDYEIIKKKKNELLDIYNPDTYMENDKFWVIKKRKEIINAWEVVNKHFGF